MSTTLDASHVPVPLLGGASVGRRPKQRPRILLIDPDAASREIESLLVRYYGYEVRSTPSAVVGLALARTEAPDAIVCELFAGAPGGRSTVSLLKSDPATSRIPVVVVSAWCRDGDRERARAAGAAEFLSKPCRGDLLKEVLARLVGTPEPAAAAA